MNFRNLAFQSVNKVLSSTASGKTLGGQVPAGKRRFITFLMVDGLTAERTSGLGVYIASVGVSNPTAASIMATGNRKLLITASATQISRNDVLRPVVFPIAGPTANAPLFSIAGGKWLAAYSTATTVNLTVGYFDE